MNIEDRLTDVFLEIPQWKYERWVRFAMRMNSTLHEAVVLEMDRECARLFGSGELTINPLCTFSNFDPGELRKLKIPRSAKVRRKHAKRANKRGRR